MAGITLPLVEPNPAALVAAAHQLSDSAIGPRDIRAVKTLRISVTDHCNLRCVYCMPEEGVHWLPREALLTYEEITAVARSALALGIRDFKLTGGEPLLRRELTELVRMLRRLPGAGEISLTTNGILLEREAAALRSAGLDRVTVSLDTLDPRRFREITRGGDLHAVLAGIAAAETVGLGPVKLNVVVMRDYNADELGSFAEHTRRHARTVRFIEFMPLGRSRLLTEGDQFVSYAEIRSRIEWVCGLLAPAEPDRGSGPARVFRLDGAVGKVGFIHAMSAPFCATCNRLRLTASGQLRSCLFDGGEVELLPLLRPTENRAALRAAFVSCVAYKPDVHGYHGERQMSQIGG